MQIGPGVGVPTIEDPLEGSRRGQQVQTDPSSKTGVVRLLQTVKIPAEYKKIVRRRVHGGVREELVLLMSTMDVPALQMADSALDASDQEYANLILENHRTEKVKLKKGTDYRACGKGADREYSTRPRRFELF